MQDLEDMKKALQEARAALKEANRQSQEVRSSVHQAQNCLDKASNLVLSLGCLDARSEEMSQMDYLDLRVREMQGEIDRMRTRKMAEDAPPPRGGAGIASHSMPVRPDKTPMSQEMVRRAGDFSEADYDKLVRAHAVHGQPRVPPKLSTDDFAKEAAAFERSAFRQGG